MFCIDIRRVQLMMSKRFRKTQAVEGIMRRKILVEFKSLSAIQSDDSTVHMSYPA